MSSLDSDLDKALLVSFSDLLALSHSRPTQEAQVLESSFKKICKTIRSSGRSDKDLTFIAAIEDWIVQESIAGILQNRRAQPLKPHQFYDRWGSR